MNLTEIVSAADDFVWGPVMLILLVGTGIFLTFRLKFRPWKNLGYAVRSTLSKEARTTSRGEGDVSPFSALTTALAATIGTGNIVGVATAMVAGGPGALVWMWISACFGLSSKFSECMLAIKYRETNEKGEMSGGPMYTMKNGFKNKKAGAVLGMIFAVFAVIASFGIGNMTQANSISEALNNTFGVPEYIAGIVLTILSLIIIVGGIKSISKVSCVVVPAMAIFYVIAGLIVIIINIENVPAGIIMIFKMAFSFDAVGGGLCGAITAALMNAMRYGVARGVFSNEAGMGSAAITAAAATTDDPVRQGYISMTGTFWDTIVVCTITGLCIASSGILGMTDETVTGRYEVAGNNVAVVAESVSDNSEMNVNYTCMSLGNRDLQLCYKDKSGRQQNIALEYASEDFPQGNIQEERIVGTWNDAAGNEYIFGEDGSYKYKEVVQGSALTIKAFSSAFESINKNLGALGAALVTIGITLFAFSTILGWEYHGEKAFEYILKTHKFNMIYRVAFSMIVYVGATQSLQLVWSFSDIANALMAIPNLISLLALSSVVAKESERFQPIINEEKKKRKLK